MAAMTLQQLRCVGEVVRQGFSVSLASRQLHMSQSAVSKQIQQLERELGAQLFLRAGRKLLGLTATGERVHPSAEGLLNKVRSLSQFARGLRVSRDGTLSIGTTHTQACYFLPDIIEHYHRSHPRVQLELHVGTHDQICEYAAARRIEFAVASGAAPPLKPWLTLPIYRWYRCAIVTRDHPLTRLARVSLVDLAQYRLITYSFGPAGDSSLLRAFQTEGVDADIALTARDADVIKTYVRLGLGVGIVAETALDPLTDSDLIVVDTSHLLPEHHTWVAFARQALLKRHIADFVLAVAPYLDASALASVQQMRVQKQIDALIGAAAVPLRRYCPSEAPARLRGVG